jgi:hypothetical protein
MRAAGADAAVDRARLWQLLPRRAASVGRTSKLLRPAAATRRHDCYATLTRTLAVIPLWLEVSAVHRGFKLTPRLTLGPTRFSHSTLSLLDG